MISTDALHVGFLSSLTIVNKGLSLMIVNEGSSLTTIKETTNFIKTIILKNNSFQKRSLSIFCRRFHNETIIFLKNENVNIPSTRAGNGNNWILLNLILPPLAPLLMLQNVSA